MTRPRVLSHQVEAIEYTHADDGLPYRHDFTRGDSEMDVRADGSVLIRNKKAKLWDLFTMDDGKQQPFLINPRGVRDSTRSRTMAKRKKKRGARNFGERMAAARRRKTNAPKRRRRNPVNLMARKRKAAKRRRVNPPKRHVRRRRNPPSFSVNGLLTRAMQGAMDGALVVSGKAAVRLVSKQFSYADGSMMDSAVELAAAVALGIVGPRVVGQDRARFLMAGGFASVIETLVAQSGVPVVSGLLGSTAGVDTRMVYNAADAPMLVRDGTIGAYAKAAPGTPRVALSSGMPLNGYRTATMGTA